MIEQVKTGSLCLIVYLRDAKPGRFGGERWILSCDECSREYEFQATLTKKEGKLHICKQCANSVKNISQLRCVKEKIERTNETRYGTKKYFASKHSQEKIVEFNLKKHGVPYHTMTDGFLEKCKQTNLKNLGVEWTMQSTKVQQKSVDTNFEKYGVHWPMQRDEVKAKIDWKNSAKLRHETMKKNGSYNFSKLEEKFYDWLVTIFSCDDVEHHVCVFGNEVDFYIKSIDTYVQFDGKYWHGLDRPIEVLEASNTERDKSILSTYKRDLRQNEKFLSENMRLIRIMEVEFKNALKQNLLSEIENKIRKKGI